MKSVRLLCACAIAISAVSFVAAAESLENNPCSKKKKKKWCNKIKACHFKNKKCGWIAEPCRGLKKAACKKQKGCSYTSKRCTGPFVPTVQPTPHTNPNTQTPTSSPTATKDAPCASYKKQARCRQEGSRCKWKKGSGCVQMEGPPTTKPPTEPKAKLCGVVKSRLDCGKIAGCVWKPHSETCATKSHAPFKKPLHEQPTAADLGLSGSCAEKNGKLNVCGFGTSWSKKTGRCEMSVIGRRRISMDRDDSRPHRGHFESNGRRFQIRHRYKADLPNINVDMEELSDACVDWSLSEEVDDELEFISPVLSSDYAAANFSDGQVIECRSKSNNVNASCEVDETWQDCAWIIAEDVQKYENVTCGALAEDGVTLVDSLDAENFDACVDALGDTASHIVHNGYVMARYMKWDGASFVTLGGDYAVTTLEAYSEHLTTFTFTITIKGKKYTYTITITPFPTTGGPTPQPSTYPTTYQPTFGLLWNQGDGHTELWGTSCHFDIDDKVIYEQFKNDCIRLFALDFMTEADADGMTEIVMPKLRWTSQNMNFRNMPDLVKIDLPNFETARQDMYFFNLPLLSEENVNIPFKNPGPDGHFNWDTSHDADLLVHRSINGVLNYDHIGGTLDIRECVFKDLSFMQGLFWVQSIYIMDNPELESLDGLENILKMTGTVVIMNNPKLTDFRALAKIPKTYSLSSNFWNNFGGMWIVSGNGENPQSIDELRDLYPKTTTPDNFHNYPGYPNLLVYQNNEEAPGL